MEILREESGGPAQDSVRAAVRLASIRWFEPRWDARDPARRIAEAAHEHAARLGLEPRPGRVRLLTRADGARLVARRELGERWHARLAARAEVARAELIRTGRGTDHPALLFSGEALLLRPSALPIDVPALEARLRAAPLEAAVAAALTDRVLWQMAGLLAWELVADRLGLNPFTPLLALYEEGLLPLDFDAEAVVLWAP